MDGCGESTFIKTRLSLFITSDSMQQLHISVDHFTYVHESNVHKIFLGLLFTYKIVLQLIALFLAFRTNDIKVKGLDDAKYIITTVYLTTISMVLVIMTFYLLKGYLNTCTSMLTLLIFISTTTILGLVFIPKVTFNDNAVL